MTAQTYPAGGSNAECRAGKFCWSRIAAICLALSLTVLGAGCDALAPADEGAGASGFIEARSYSLASATGGTVSEVLVDVGQAVLVEQALLSLDTAGLESTRIYILSSW